MGVKIPQIGHASGFLSAKVKLPYKIRYPAHLQKARLKIILVLPYNFKT